MKNNNKLKRIFALIGVVILVLMYVVTIVFAIIDDPKTMSYFKASVFLTFLIPIFIYANQILIRFLKGRGRDGDDTEGE